MFLPKQIALVHKYSLFSALPLLALQIGVKLKIIAFYFKFSYIQYFSYYKKEKLTPQNGISCFKGLSIIDNRECKNTITLNASTFGFLYHISTFVFISVQHIDNNNDNKDFLF